MMGCRDHLEEIEGLQKRLKEVEAHNTYLTEMFYGIASMSVCERHNAVSIVDRARYDRVVVPSCQDCLADDLSAMVAGNPDATTMAARLKETSARNLSLVIENHRLNEQASASSAQREEDGT